MALFPKDRPPKKKFFIMEMPMPAEGRELNLLGVAFEDPRVATLGRYTPQGPEEEKSKELTTSAYIASVGANLLDSLSRSIHQPSSEMDTQAGAQEVPALQGIIDYMTPCAWPKDLAKENKIKLYSNPLRAVGVEAILENVKEGDVVASIKNAMSFGLNIKKEDLDTLIVPIFRRWSMEDPWTKIYQLLHNVEYRKRVIDLFNKSHKEKKILYVATSLIACGGVSHDRVKADEQELSSSLKDGTDTVPVRIQGEIRHIKRDTLKGTYDTDIVLCLSYRRIRYVVEQEEHVGSRWWGTRGRKQKLETRAIRFEREDGARDVFYIDDYEAEGDAVPWMGAATPSENRKAELSSEEWDSQGSDDTKSTIFENAVLVDDLETERSEEDFPEDFFEPDESDASDDE
jgi:hypothetical protein